MKLFRKIFKYKPGYEYWVYRKDIHVPIRYRMHRIGKKKFNEKIRHYHKTGEFASPIIINHNFSLVDGYSSIVIAEIMGLDKIPVYFINEEGTK